MRRDTASAAKYTLQNALLEEGKTFSSQALASEMDSVLSFQSAHLDILIGSPYGVDPELKKEAHKLISLSPMTFPHDWARVLTMEQIYRGMCIIKGHPYHHA